MYTFLDNMFKVLKMAANNEQQKDLAALAICGNNLEAIDVLAKTPSVLLEYWRLATCRRNSARDHQMPK